MKTLEHYTRYKTNYRPAKNPLLPRAKVWQLALLTLAVFLIEPLLIYKNQRSIPFSLSYYLRVLEYSMLVVVPVTALLLWLNWRESIRQRSGYGWIGKFEVLKKRAALIFYYVQLVPGNHRVRVERRLFDRIQTGDFVIIRRDAFGTIEEIQRVNNIPVRLARSKMKKTI